jgi:hypothetical protein
LAPGHLTTSELGGAIGHVAALLERKDVLPKHLRGPLAAWLVDLRGEADERAATEAASRPALDGEAADDPLAVLTGTE